MTTKFGTSVLGELKQRSKSELCAVLGKVQGEGLYWAIRGVEMGKGLEGNCTDGDERKSVSCDINASYLLFNLLRICLLICSTVFGSNGMNKCARSWKS